MIKDELKEFIVKELNQMGCKNIKFSNGEENFAVVFFDCDNLTSFRREIPDWVYTGIQLKTDKKEEEDYGKYKIEFRKTQ